MPINEEVFITYHHSCKFVQNTYTRILNMILNNHELDETIMVLIDIIYNFFDNKIPYRDLVINRKEFTKFFLTRPTIRERKNPVFDKKTEKNINIRDNSEFVIVVVDSYVTSSGYKIIPIEQYIKRLHSPNPERIDYNFYIKYALMHNIDPLFDVGFKDMIDQLPHVSYRPNRRHKNIYLNNPIKIILAMKQNGYDIEIFKKTIRYNYHKLKNKNILS